MNLATTPSMETEPNKPSQAELLAKVLNRCKAGIAASRQQLSQVEETLDKLVGMTEKGAKAAHE